MVERSKDSEDRALEALFAAEPIADDGFSKRVVGRIRRRIWLRRLALPVAMSLGALIAVKPALALFQAVQSAAAVLPQELPGLSDLGPIDPAGLSAWMVVAAVGIASLAFIPALDD